jgi:O-antigen/teichoic acid export membrane protein
MKNKNIAHNTIYNMIGQGVPILAAIFAIPVLVHGLGVEKFGVLSLAWVVIGYFSLFDLGMGRALTKLVAEKLGKKQEEDIPQLIWTTLIVMTVMGCLGTAILVLLSPWLIQSVLKIPTGLRTETLDAFYLLAATIPLVISTSALSGIMAALQRFDIINYIRLPMGVFNFLGPLLILPYSNSLVAVVSVLVLSRLIVWIVYWVLSLRIVPSLRKSFTFNRSQIRPVLEFGSWITVGGIIGPLTMYFDRFVISGVVSIASVAYYTTPFDMITKIFIISNALSAVLFPAFSYSFGHDSNSVKQIYHRSMKYLFLGVFPMLLILSFFAKDIIAIWIGIDFARESFRALQILSFGVLMLSIESIPFALLQGAGKPDVPVKLNLLELPFYIGGIWWLTKTFGINGAAFAWACRAGVDTLVLMFFVSKLLTEKIRAFYKIFIISMLSMIIFILAMISLPFYTKLVVVMLASIAYIYLAWLYLLDSDERHLLKSKLNFAISKI